MSLSIGIVGLPNVGKSTLFNALTDAQALAANYPFATIEPNTGIVPVPDTRLDKLAELYKSKKIVPATVTFVDIAGLVAGASKGEGLGNQFLSHIRTCNAICQVVRAFDDPNITRAGHSDSKALRSDGVQGADEKRTEPYMKYGEGVSQSATQQSAESTSGVAGSAGQSASAAQSLSDIEVINTELILADIQTVNNRIPKVEKETKANPKIKPLLELLHRVKAGLDEGKLAGSFLNSEELEEVRDLQLLSAKPFVFVYNIGEDQLTDEKLQDELKSIVAPAPAIFISAKLESELRGLDEADRQELLISYGQKESGLTQLIHAAYSALGLQSYLTAGEQEVRAWTVKKDSTAPQAAGVIHGDFERGFIAAQVIDYNDLITAGSEQAAKAAGKVRTEGKTYIMQSNDVVEFRFNI
jgi:ribosome-binding ATPase YchF (GTP1/OBG family)